ncbi:MAG: hypothetical protein HFG39_09240 [Lachnospiraceae bacterium]|nr:hypothetical protein [Lachnospiraceae bacterium]
MKKIKNFISMLLITCFITSFTITSFAVEANDLDSISNDVIYEYGLEKVEEIPDDIVPIYVENEQELIVLLEQLEAEFSETEIETEEYNSISQLSDQMVNNATLTHKATIFNLSSIGGKIVSAVNYTYSYWIAPELYKTTINYHDVYEDGIYGCQEVTYNNKSATTNGPTISVNVRGYTKVYIGLSGGGAEGNLVLKTYNFDKSYTIYTGLD